MNKPDPHIAEAASEARSLVAAVDATLTELASTLFGGLSPLEQAETRRIRQAAARLLECAEELARSELLVQGSTGQLRPHPLLRVELDLRREISDSLRKLCFAAPNRAFVDQHRASLRPTGKRKTPAPGGEA